MSSHSKTKEAKDNRNLFHNLDKTVLLQATRYSHLITYQGYDRQGGFIARCSYENFFSVNTELEYTERFTKQAIMDKNAAVSSAALVSVYHVSSKVPGLVRRLANDSQAAIMSGHIMVSYHALALAAEGRRDDRMSTVKLVNKLINSPINSPYTLCLLIRLTAKLAEENNSHTSESHIQFIESCLSHTSEMVAYEAAHAIVNLRVSEGNLAQAVSVLQMFYGSSKASLRLAGVRTLALLSTNYPNAITACAADLEYLISDSNHYVATLAVTTLLATAISVDRVMKLTSNLMAQISDELRIIILRAVAVNYTKFSNQHRYFIEFLSSLWREEGDLEYKTAVADTVVALTQNSEVRETGLALICDFIEDCGYPSLTVRLLYVLSKEGAKVDDPSRYIPVFYNRILLGCDSEGAAAVSSAARLCGARPDLLTQTRDFLTRCLLQQDDELRDRALHYTAILRCDTRLIKDYMYVDYNVEQLEKALRRHLERNCDSPFDLDAATSIAKEFRSTVDIPQIEEYGKLFKRCPSVELSDRSEYYVRYVKHVFARHLVLNFECTNAFDHRLENVHVTLTAPIGYTLLKVVPCNEIASRETGNIFVVLKFPGSPSESLGSFIVSLEFTVHEATGLRYEDSYPLEGVAVGCGEQLQPISDLEAGSGWPNVVGTFELPFKNVRTAVEAMFKWLDWPELPAYNDKVKHVEGQAMWRGEVPVRIYSKFVSLGEAVVVDVTFSSPQESVAIGLLSAIY